MEASLILCVCTVSMYLALCLRLSLCDRLAFELVWLLFLLLLVCKVLSNRAASNSAGRFTTCCTCISRAHVDAMRTRVKQIRSTVITSHTQWTATSAHKTCLCARQVRDCVRSTVYINLIRLKMNSVEGRSKFTCACSKTTSSSPLKTPVCKTYAQV